MKIIFIIIIAGILCSCQKIKDYFQDPDTEVISETLRSTRLTGFSATLAMAAINGRSFQNTTVSRSNQGFPCAAIIRTKFTEYSKLPAEEAIIAGLWADANTAVLSVVFLNYSVGSRVIEILGIETIPVLMESENIHIALAGQEISLNPDQDALLAVDLDDQQFESELLRLDLPRPGDVYVAVNQKAYFIDVDTRGTNGSLSDDIYTISGGGQLILVENESAQIDQQAIVDVVLAPSCEMNPLSGMALLRSTGIENEGFPELGTIVLEFYDSCEGKARVYLATGMYAGVNGQKISFEL
jgi:hypothetical protein